MTAAEASTLIEVAGRQVMAYHLRERIGLANSD
jgi:hypothetical protein